MRGLGETVGEKSRERSSKSRSLLITGPRWNLKSVCTLRLLGAKPPAEILGFRAPSAPRETGVADPFTRSVAECG